MTYAAKPDYIPDDWLRYARGMSFAHTPPADIAADANLASDNLWERVACITLQAQAGNFSNVDSLLACVRLSDDDHLRDCALRVFALSASRASLIALAEAFSHPSHETRIEAFCVVGLTGDLDLACALARHRAVTASSYERSRVMDAIAEMIDDDEDSELIDSPLDDAAFIARVDAMVENLRARFGAASSIFRGEPLEVAHIVDAIARLCGDEEPELRGGTMAELLCLLEGMTGTPYVGCLDDDVAPVLSEVSHLLNKLRQGGTLQNFEPGRRYFFGHALS